MIRVEQFIRMGTGQGCAITKSWSQNFSLYILSIWSVPLQIVLARVPDYEVDFRSSLQGKENAEYAILSRQ